MDSNDSASPRYLTARQAAEVLGVSIQTLYAYVSRGLLHSEPTLGKSRARRYRSDEVERLVTRREERRDPAKMAAGALDFGTPLLESAITLIRDGRLYYRGHDAVALARRRTLEDVAHLLWLGDLSYGTDELFENGPVDLPRGYLAASDRDDLEGVERLAILLPLAAASDLRAHDLRPQAVARSAARLLRQMAVAACATRVRILEPPRLAGILQKAWCPEVDGAVKLFDAALILTADHELNVSSFTARCVASAGSTPYDAVTAGLAALRGKHHGGLSARTQSLLAQLFDETGHDPETLMRALARRLKQGETLPGFGHRLYPQGDPRSRALLELLEELFPDSPKVRWVKRLTSSIYEILGERPTVDFALAAVSIVLGLPPGAALSIFTLGRTVGWVGQAIEQMETGRLIRPRARYTGPVPASARAARNSASRTGFGR